MIVYKDMCFCARKGCNVYRCPRNLLHVDPDEELLVSVSDLWGKRSECPKDKPGMMGELDDENT